MEISRNLEEVLIDRVRNLPYCYRGAAIADQLILRYI